MIRFLFILFFLSAGFYCRATDTIRFETGEPHFVMKNRECIVEFYKNGKAQRTKRPSGFFRKGKEKNYDSLGTLVSEGKIVYWGLKYGRWKYFTNGKKDSVVKYKYGVRKDQMRTKKGRSIHCVLIYGLGAGWNSGVCAEATEKFRIRYVPVAGCIVNSRIVSKTSIHNFFIHMIMIPKYGINWEDKMEGTCAEKIRVKF